MLAGASITVDPFKPETQTAHHSKDTVTARWEAPRTWPGTGTQLSFVPRSE